MGRPGCRMRSATVAVCPRQGVQSRIAAALDCPHPNARPLRMPTRDVTATGSGGSKQGDDMARISIIYYSSTGHHHALALKVAEGAGLEGAETRVRKVRELAPDAAIDARPGWRAHLDATAEVPEATLADLEWADGFVFGTPTRFGLPAAQLKQFLDQTGGLWAQGKLQDKPVSVFGGAGNPHGGQESTLLALNNVFYHWGAVIVPTGYTDPALKAAGGNPYGVSFTASASGPSPEAQAAAVYLGRRLARFADVLAQGRANLKGGAA